MDPNKLKTLHDAGYVVGKCCGLCVHATFEPGKSFGQCAKLPYRHAKHSVIRHASVHAFGECSPSMFEPDPKKTQRLSASGFDHLLDRRAFTRNNRRQRTIY